MDFINRESNLPTFYARTCSGGERIVIMYDSHSKGPAIEVEIDSPQRLHSKKCYLSKELQSLEEPFDESTPDPVFQNIKNFYDNIINMSGPRKSST